MLESNLFARRLMQMKLLAFVSICHGISHETHYTNVVHAIIADLSQTEKYTVCQT